MRPPQAATGAHGALPVAEGLVVAFVNRNQVSRPISHQSQGLKLAHAISERPEVTQ
jgi:hypothetical protein